MSPEKTKGLQAAFVGEVAGGLVALVLCRSWLISFVDHRSGFWPPGSRHDVFAPGESLLLISIYAVAAAISIALALLCVRRIPDISTSERASVVSANRGGPRPNVSMAGKDVILAVLPAVITSLIIFETLVLPRLPLPDVVISNYVVRLPMLVGSVVGAFAFAALRR